MILPWWRPGGKGLGSRTCRTPSMYTTTSLVSPAPHEENGRGLTTLGARLSRTSRSRILRTPVQRLSVRMNPEEPLMPLLRQPLPDRPPRVLVQELTNHRLRDSVDDGGVSRVASSSCTLRTRSPVHVLARAGRRHGCSAGGVAVDTHVGRGLLSTRDGRLALRRCRERVRHRRLWTNGARLTPEVLRRDSRARSDGLVGSRDGRSTLVLAVKVGTLGAVEQVRRRRRRRSSGSGELASVDGPGRGDESSLRARRRGSHDRHARSGTHVQE